MAGIIGALLIRLGIKADGSPIDNIEKKLKGLSGTVETAGKKLQNFGSRMQTIGTAASAAIGLPVAAAAVAVAKFAGDFDQQMRELEAVAGATGEELAALREKAIQLGTDTQFSASEASAGMIEFSKAGMSAAETLDTIGPALQFASASGLQLGQIASIMSDTMSQFGLASSDATHIADVFSKAADASTTSVDDLSQAMVEAAPYARLVGADLAETATLLGALANAGIKGSKAGTALKNGFIGLAASTPKAKKALADLGIQMEDIRDSKGNMKVPFTELIEQLAGAGMSIEQGVAIFGRESAGAMLSIINDFEKVKKVSGAMAGLEGNAARQAAVKMKGFNGAVKGLNSALQTLAIRIGESGVLDFFEKAVLHATNWAKAFANMNPGTLRFIAIVGGVAAGVAGLITILGGAIAVFGTVAIAATAMWTAISWPVVVAVALIAGAFLAIFVIVDDFLAWMDGRPSLIGTWLEKLEQDSPAFYATMKNVFTKAKELAVEFWEALPALFSQFFSPIIALVNVGAYAIWGLSEALKTAFTWGEKLWGLSPMEAGHGPRKPVPGKGGPRAGLNALAGLESVLPPSSFSGMGALANPGLSGNLATGLADARTTTRPAVNNSAATSLNAPITINVSAGVNGQVDADLIGRKAKKAVADVYQSASQGARPVYSQ